MLNPYFTRVQRKDIEIFSNLQKLARILHIIMAVSQNVLTSCRGRKKRVFYILDGRGIIMTQETITIENKTGIHARPASIFVQTATKFKSKVQIQAKGKTVDAKSILMIMSMGLVKGTEMTIVADGPDEAEAVKALKDLVASKFGEE